MESSEIQSKINKHEQCIDHLFTYQDELIRLDIELTEQKEILKQIREENNKLKKIIYKNNDLIGMFEKITRDIGEIVKDLRKKGEAGG